MFFVIMLYINVHVNHIYNLVFTNSTLASSDHNPFESDDLVVPLGVASHGSSAAPGLTEIIPPADLNDMDEFPPLGNMD